MKLPSLADPGEPPSETVATAALFTTPSETAVEKLAGASEPGDGLVETASATAVEEIATASQPVAGMSESVAAAPAPLPTASDWFARGRAALMAQDFPRAHEAFVHAIALDDSNASYRDGLAIACTQSGQVEAALAAYRMAVMLDPKDGFAWYNTGILEFNAGRTAEAIEAFRQAGDAYLARGDQQRAGQAADRLQEIAAVYHSGEHT